MDWAEIVSEFNLSMHPDSLRRAGMGVRLVMEANMLMDESCMRPAESTNPPCESSPDEQDRRQYIEQQKLRDMRREINEDYRANARSEMLRESVIEATKSMGRLDFSLPLQVASQNDTGFIWHGDKRLVVGIADVHYGADWLIHGLMGEIINEYNPEIFEDRMERLLKEIVAILSREELNQVTLLIAGDSLDGMLRASQLVKIRYGAVESAMRYAEFMSQWIFALSAYAEVDVYMVDGNHSETRPLGSKRGQFENENLEKIVAWYLESRLSSIDQVHIDGKSEKRKLLDVCGYSVLLTHGDDEKRIGAMAQQAILQYGSKIDFMVCGHKHREQELPSGNTPGGDSIVIRLPSICGVDSFAMNKGWKGQPGALTMVIERGYGRRCVYPIRLDEKNNGGQKQ